MDTPERADDPLLGRLLEGRYRLVSLLARGGMGTVYVGTDERLDRPVAVKLMHRALADDPDFVARFTREARSAARLSAAEVVAVYDTGRDPGTGAAYLVMELVRGRDLRSVLRERGALPPSRALAVLEPVLHALAAAHRAGIVHRDVKPENVLLADDGRVKVADFGLARAVEASELTATTGLLIGTVAYLAPEQVEQGRSDARSDVYAAGVVLWEALTGRPPYEADSPLSVAYRHVHDDVPPPSSRVGGIPPALDDLVLRATSRNPAHRPLDAGAMLAELQAVRRNLPPDLPAVARPSAGPRQDTLVVPRPAVPPGPRPPWDAGPPASGPPLVPAAAPPPRRRAGSAPVAAYEGPVQTRRGRRRGLVLALVVLLVGLLAGGGAWYLGTGRYTRAPGLLGQTQAVAEQRLGAAGLQASVGAPAFDEQVPAGHVLDQDPDPGARVRKGGAVRLVLSKGQDRRTVPAVTGSTQEAATAALQAVGLRAGDVEREFSSRPSGTVLRTDPEQGSRLRPQARVALVVSKGVEQLPVPSVVGQLRPAAESALRKAGFRSTAERVFDDVAPAGTVLQQSPSSGTAGRGSTVTLTVSKGPDLVTVPDLRGRSRADADAGLAAAGLVPRAIDLPDGAGTVVTQSPAPGSRVRRGSTVTYYVL